MFDRLRALFRSKAAAANEAEPASQPNKVPTQIPGWIGVDLDGTLAEYTTWKGIAHIGSPIPLMLRRIETWLEGGYTVKIMTARASVPEGAKHVSAWLKAHDLPSLEVTNEKDFEMIELWDDRAVQVVANSGRPILKLTHGARPKAPLLTDEEDGATCEIQS